MAISVRRVWELITDWEHKEVAELEQLLGVHPNRQTQPVPAAIGGTDATSQAPQPEPISPAPVQPDPPAPTPTYVKPPAGTALTAEEAAAVAAVQPQEPAPEGAS